MSDESTPRPTGPRLSHLHSEPVPISFASPQQIAMLTAGHGSIFDNMRMHSPQQHQHRQPIGAARATNPHQHRPRQPAPHHEAFGLEDGDAPGATPPNTKILKALPPQAIILNNFKGFKFFAPGGLQSEARELYDKISGTFKWETCENQADRCVEIIQNQCADRRVFLIGSGSLGSQIVPRIHDLPQVYAIYIYCANVKFHREWASKYKKVRTVCDDDNRDLLPIFTIDVVQSNVDWANALFEQGTRDKAKEKFQLAYDKLNTYGRNYDPAMKEDISKKLAECQ